MAARRRQADRRNWPVNLYLNSQGTYWFRNPQTGKTFGLGKDFKVASAQAKTANAELERRKGDVGLLQRINGAQVSLRAWCETYKEMAAAKDDANPRTLSTLRSEVNKIQGADFSVHTIGEVAPKDVSDFLKSVERDVSASRAAKIRTRLSDVFNEAIGDGLLDAGKNPVDAIRKPQGEVVRQRLTLEDFLAIIAEARKEKSDDKSKPSPSWAANALLLALLTGQRREDIKQMQFDHIKDGYLWVEQQKSQGRTKLKIPLSVGLSAVGMTIGDVIKACRDNVVSKSIIHHVRHHGRTKPGEGVKAASLSSAFAEARDAAKIAVAADATPPTFHEIRSLAARLYADEYGPEFAQAIMGHKSASMTALYRDSRGREWTEVKLRAS